MKKSMKKMLILMLTVLMAFTLYTVPAFAQSGTASAQSGVTVKVVPDKTSYTATENIVVTLTVTNNSGADVTNVSLQQVVPKGYTVEKDKAIKSIGTLKNGESQSLKVTLIPNNSATVRPKTGDTSKTLILLVILAIAVIAAIVCIILLLKGRGSRGTRTLSLILVLAMTMTAIPAIGSTTTVSAETTGSPASGTAVVTVDGASLTLVGYAYYNDGAASAVTLGTLAVDKDHVKIGDEGQIHFYLKVTGAPDSVGLYNAKGDKVADLNDKGSSGDKQAGDGVYSVDRKLVSNQEGTATFYVGYSDQKSNTVTITFYKEKSQDDTYNCTVTGYIYDAKTNEPIKTATISVYSGTTLINRTAISESDKGHYTIKVPAGTYNVIVESDGYQSQGAKGLSITGNKTLPSLGLVPKEEEAKMGAVTGTITDIAGANIAEATVSIYSVIQGEEKTIVTLTTGENGYYYTALEVGSYTVRVSKDGYNGDSKTITIGAEGAQIDASFALLPVEPEPSTETETPETETEEYQYTAVLNWNTTADLDLHVVSVSGDATNYNVSCEFDTADGCRMTQFTNTGYGPEIIQLNMNAEDSYYFYAEDYDGGDISESGAVMVLYNGSEKVAEYEISSAKSGRDWNIFAVIKGSMVECNTVTDQPDTSYTSTPEEETTETTTEAATETTTEAPAETTTETAAETTTEAPVETTTEAPVETTTEAPVETTTEAPVETTTEAPVETTTEAVSYEYTASLYWNDLPADLDLHVVAVSGGMVVYDVPADGSVTNCMRDADITTGYGPETVELNMEEGYNYYFYAKNSSLEADIASSGAFISLSDNGADIEDCYLSASGSGAIWNAFAIIDGTIVECNTITDVADTSYTSTPVEEPAVQDDAAADDSTVTDESTGSDDTAGTDEIPVWVEEEETFYSDENTDGDAEDSVPDWTDDSTGDDTIDAGIDGEDGIVEETPDEGTADTDEGGSSSDQAYVQNMGCLYVGVLDTDGTLVSDGSYTGDDSSDLYELADNLGVSLNVQAYTSKDEMISDLKNNVIDIIWKGLDNTDISWDMSIDIYDLDGDSWDCYNSSNVVDGVSESGRFFGLRSYSDLADSLHDAVR